ncbi:N-formylglutamate amidohydrolase [Commensalibacter sp. M0134]|uniref:N-formylglutamate amidohydrolase n=1 Tax=Commensalibacter TaxID=1079922 RepID=UPI0018DE5E12|nr:MULTISPECIES: N-formylglutamate amidohydrolase [Commensalibacter]MBI0065564.1 N-formylglutamate amidohydrolase [Commensalibacter sp. M0134]MBI0069447.1 N-formylglutamate amidohydrolase [Commensalibacter sp. M0133]MBI0080950.1 N-formylglutamate amidohydrolase [Commensalibacter melissae]
MFYKSKSSSILSVNDPDPVNMINRHSISPFLIICDHAGKFIPEKLNNLGLEPNDLERHIAFDIGIKGVGKKLAKKLNATLILQNYSRLVIDCNRNPNHENLIIKISDKTVIKGNLDLSDEEKKSRVSSIYNSYHACIEQDIERRQNAQISTCLIALHSLTPQMDNIERPWHAGILHDRYPGFGLIFKKYLEQYYEFPIGDNEPYRLNEKNDYSVPCHAFGRKLLYLELEIRQDLIRSEIQQREWADRLAYLLPLTLQEYGKR